MQVESIAECSKGEHSAILLTFIKLPFVIKIFALFIFECRFTQVLLYLDLDNNVTRYVVTSIILPWNFTKEL